MNHQSDTRRKSVNWNGPRGAMLALALLLPAFGVGFSSATHSNSQQSGTAVCSQSASSGNRLEGLLTRASEVAASDMNTLMAVNWNDELIPIHVI